MASARIAADKWTILRGTQCCCMQGSLVQQWLQDQGHADPVLLAEDMLHTGLLLPVDLASDYRPDGTMYRLWCDEARILGSTPLDEAMQVPAGCTPAPWEPQLRRGSA